MRKSGMKDPEAGSKVEIVIFLIIIASIIALFLIGPSANTTQECHSVPARYGGVECPEPNAHFNIGSGELEWE